jgi:2-polyprenyl-3-methyl-5-hydroxy-6-metoxy-1,4-benzoquinol methylase
MRFFDFNTRNQKAKPWLDRAEKCADILMPLLLEGEKERRREGEKERRREGEKEIADVGCGDEKLCSMLKMREVDFSYQGFDLQPQSERVLSFDARKDYLPKRFDIVVSLGLLEYLDIPAYLARVRLFCQHFVCSYVPSDRMPNQKERSALGWVNYLTEHEIERLLSSANFTIVDRRLTNDEKTVLWRCV